jgi:beta-lysine N6-acetyltransferase
MNDITEENKMLDKIEKIGKSIIQHGKFNNRIYLLKFNRGDSKEIIPALERLASEKGYSKIFCKIQSDALPEFILNGYVIEAYVPRFYDGKTDCLMVSRFFDENRRLMPAEELKLLFEWLKMADKQPSQASVNKVPEYKPVRLGPGDVTQITGIFSEVFETYPFPIHDPDYILDTIRQQKAQYFGIRNGDKLIGVSTAEIDTENRNAEMTDFAVLPGYRGARLAYRLLLLMEKEMKDAGIKTAYTIARLKEPGMNKTFIRAGYKYSGTLVNNTNIGGNIESMNIYYKHL